MNLGTHALPLVQDGEMHVQKDQNSEPYSPPLPAGVAKPWSDVS